MAFDPDSGSLWIGDPGQDAEEEVSLAAAGANLGWPIFEGSDCLNMTGDVRRFYGVSTGYPCTESDDVTAPVATYGRIDGCAVIGGRDITAAPQFPGWPASTCSATSAAGEFGRSKATRIRVGR